MSPLDRQYHDQLDAQPQGCGDAGELNGGHSPQPELQAWHQSGAADDLMSRSLLQVQQQEAWLQSQSGSTLLDQGTAQVPFLRDWAAAAAADSPGEAEVRTLVVVHTGLPNWQQQLPGLGQHDDLLLVPPDQGGIRLVQDALVGRTYDRVQLLLGETWSSDGSSWQLGRDALSGNLQQALALEPAVAIDVVQAQAIATTPLDSADELLGLVRQNLQIAMEQGRLEAAVVDAFSEASRAGVLAAAKALLQGEQGPQLQWARFQQSSIRGAFLQERNTVLISEQLQNGGAELEAVLLEELGHWLESAAADDSHGDEGERFSAILRGHTLAVEVGRDRANLLIDGEVVQAELAQIVSGSQQQGVLSDNRNAITLAFDEPLTSTPENWSRIRFNNASGIAIANFPAVSHFSIESNKLTIHLVSPVDTAILTNGLKVSYDASSGYGGTELSGATGPVGSFSAFVNFTSTSGSGPATSNDLLSVTLTGTNNAPVISAVTDVTVDISELADGATGENATTLSDYGFFSITDVDLTDVQSVSVTPPNAARGSLTAQVANNITADGARQINWSYSVADAALDSLAAGQVIQEVFTLNVSDGKGGSVNQLVTVTLTGTNDAPNLTSSTGNGAEDTNSTAFMAGSDPEGSAIAVLRVRDTGSPSAWVVVNQDRDADGSSLTNGYGTLRIRPYGTFNFLADGPLSQALAAGQQAQVSFTYEATDGLLISSSTVAFTLTGSNDVPTVVADNVTIQEDAVLIREASQGVLANDVDVDTAGSQLRIFKVGLPGQAAMEMTSNDYVILSNTYGTLLMRSNGAYSFVADGHASQALAPGQSATTSFIYQAWDGITINDFGNYLPPADPLRATSTLSITITGTNDAPLINGELNLGPIQEDGSFAITTAQLLASTTDIDSPGSSLTVVSLSVDARQGQITPVTGSNNNSWTFTPAADWSGTAELRYVISDGTNRSSRSNFSNGVQLKGDRLFLLTTGASWANAEQQAMRLGGRLTSIESSAQQASLEEMFSFRLDQPLWIGFNDAGQEGTWTWNDGSAITFTRWRGFSPWGSITPFNPNQTWGGGGDIDYAVLMADQATVMADQATGPYPRRDWGVFPVDVSFSNLMGIAEIPYLRRGDSAYVIVQGPTWEQAEANAVKLGGHLVTINDAAENEWLISNGLVGSGRWFGFSDQNSEGDWRWSDSSLTNYRNWSSGNPDNSTASNVSEGQDFGVIVSNGYWDDGENPLWPGITPLSGIAEINLAAVSRLVVSPVNDAPVVQVPAAQQLLEDTTLSFSIANGNQLVVADVDANTLEVRLHVNAGTLTLAPAAAAGITVLEGSSGVSNLLRISGTAAAINAALDGLVYTPLADRSGSDELTLQLSDRGQSGTGGNQDSYARVAINPGEDQPSTFSTAQLLQGFSDPDPGDQLRVESLHVSSGNGRLAVDANGQWTFTPEAHANGPVTLAYEVVDGHGGRLAATNGFTINAVNDAPRRLDAGPKALYVIEDAAITSLGLANLAWATGAGRDPASDQLRQIADEASQTLTFTVTAVPAARLGQIGLLDANNAFSPVTAGAQLSQEQMQALQFRAAADAYGTGSFTYAVSDGAAAQGGLTTTETFTINVLAVNDTPVRTSLAELAPLLIDNTKLKVDPVTNLYKTVSVGLVNLLFRAGGDALEQASQQQLLYRISQLPNATVGQVLLAGGVTAVVQGQTYSLDQLRDLIFRPARGVEKLTAAERLGELRLEVTDSPSPSGDPALTTELKVQILIDTNKASGRAGMRIAGLTSDEQAIQAVLALDPTNPDTGFQDPAGGNGTARGLNTSIYSQLENDNPLYVAALGGNTVLDGQEVNYVPSAVPFLFDLPINAWAPTSWANGGPDPTHTLLYRSTLSGQLRSNDELIYTVVPGSAPAGFTLSSSGAWSFDPLHAAYAGLTTEGANQQVTVGYQAGTRTGEITIELRRTATTVIAEVVGNVGAITTSRGDWIAANPEGRDKDRYFKYVSEYVLTSYGARDTGEKNEAGEKLFTWGGSIATADGQPLRQLNGTPITSAGYYDFTRREGLGDGVEFIYETVSEKGKQVDYITGMRFFLRNNVFGDNDPSASNIRDPGAPVTILRELGVITTIALTQEGTLRNSAPPPGPDSVVTRLRSDGSLPGLVDIDPSQYENSAKLSMLLSSGSAGDSSSGMMAQGTGAGDDDGTSTGSAAGDPAGKGAGVGGLDAGADKIAKGRGPGDGGDSTAEGLGQGAGERGLRLDPLPILATAALATPASLLGSLSETNLLGGNLLDALALGAGLLYLLYGPKAVDQGKRGLRGWLAGVAGGSRRGAAVPGEQLVLSLILTRQENGSLQLVAAQLTAGGVKLLAQQDLASAEAWQEAASALLAGLQQQGQRYDLLLLDGQLDRALPATDQSLAALAQQRLPLATAELAAAVAAASPAEFAALQQWLNKPSLTLPADSAVAQALQRRCAVHGQTLPPDQAKMAAMLELSLALTWSQRRNR